MWGCKPHWFALPKRLRDRIWETYQIGQEVSMRPSIEYLEAARAVQEWIAANPSPSGIAANPSPSGTETQP